MSDQTTAGRAEAVDDILGDLSSPSAGDVAVATRDYDAKDLAAAAARRALDGGGGGGIPSGAGSPYGVVTPTVIGQLYVDDTNGGIYIAGGLTDEHWILVGGRLDNTGPDSFPGVGGNGDADTLALDIKVLAPAPGVGGGIYLGDVDADQESGDGIRWHPGGSSGGGYADVQTGAGAHTLTFGSDGHLTVDGALVIAPPAGSFQGIDVSMPLGSTAGQIVAFNEYNGAGMQVLADGTLRVYSASVNLLGVGATNDSLVNINETGVSILGPDETSDDVFAIKLGTDVGGNFPFALVIRDSDNVRRFSVDGYGNTQIELAEGSAFYVADDTNTPILTVVDDRSMLLDGPATSTSRIAIAAAAPVGDYLLYVANDSSGADNLAYFQGSAGGQGAVSIDKYGSVVIESGSGSVQAALSVASDHVAKHALEVWDSGFNNVRFAIGSNGELGFYGATPAAQPAVPTTLEDVIAALQTLGLVAA